MLLDELPVEILTQIFTFLEVKDIYTLCYTNKYIYNIIKTLFIDKEKWLTLNNLENINDIVVLINKGYRYINRNKSIQLIYNYTLVGNKITQIMTDQGILSVNLHNFKKVDLNLYNLFPEGRKSKEYVTKILIDAPYNFKRKGIKKY